jgi:hypothetical protein
MLRITIPKAGFELLVNSILHLKGISATSEVKKLPLPLETGIFSSSMRSAG